MFFAAMFAAMFFHMSNRLRWSSLSLRCVPRVGALYVGRPYEGEASL